MTASDFIRRPLWIFVAAAMLTCCSGVQSSRGAPSALPQRAVIPTHAEYNASWMMPEAKEIKKLLYVSDWDANDVEVYRYDTGEEVGLLVESTSRMASASIRQATSGSRIFCRTMWSNMRTAVRVRSRP